ncbi:unnamed protein product [Moneuplotes crassus]|uniref:Mitotic-spindle organizing protein 1 n=1 Tax=Euplotes crassus TaxID=5936 RepID=A0AAD1Y1Z4_EUPCR|nr:unnamed protein product [Moneuplotes crassus]
MNGKSSAADFEEAQETIDILYEISKLLNCGVNKKTLAILLSLTANGVNPEAIAAVYKELKRETAALKAAEVSSRNS